MAGRGGNGVPAEQEFPGWSVAKAQEDPHPPVRHVHAARGLPAQARHKNEEGPAHFIPGISNSRPSHQATEEQWDSKPTSSVAIILMEALQHQKAELKEKAHQLKGRFPYFRK